MSHIIKFLLCISCLGLAVPLLSQINVGSEELVKLKPGKIDSADLERLKKTETVFVCGVDVDPEIWKKTLEEVWTLTPLKVVPVNEFSLEDYDEARTSFFTINGVSTTVSNMNSGFSYDTEHQYLHLWMHDSKAKKKDRKKTFCRIELSTRSQGISTALSMESSRDQMLMIMYQTGFFDNWHLGFIKVYLQVVNQALSANTEHWLYNSDKKNPAAKKMAKATLFVPQYMMRQNEKFTGKEKPSLTKQAMFKDYPFPYQVLPAAELSDLILKKEGLYVLLYVISSTNAYVTVFDTHKGSVVYSDYQPGTYNAKSKDLKPLTKAIQN